MSYIIEHNGQTIDLDNDLYTDVPVTMYEIVFHGTVGKQRKPRRHTFVIEGAFERDAQHNHAVHNIVECALLAKGAKAGKWSLDSYTGQVSRIQSKLDPEQVYKTVLRRLFDPSAKTLAIGELGK